MTSEERYDLEYPPGSAKRQEYETRVTDNARVIDDDGGTTPETEKVPEDQWRG
jgi:hypothetical protein